MTPSFKRLQEQAYDHLRAMVLNNELSTNEVYSEARVAETLGISRTPLRDALQKLSHDGLIDIMPSKGFRVHTLTYKDILNIYQMRCAIEGYCARLIVDGRSTPAAVKVLADMKEILSEQNRLNDIGAPVADMVELDYRLHMLIVSFSGNRVFSQIYTNQMYRMRIITFEGQTREERRLTSYDEHSRLIAVLAEGSAAEAAAGVVSHYQNMIDPARITTYHPDLAGEVKALGRRG